jgi:hypothetical protein
MLRIVGLNYVVTNVGAFLAAIIIAYVSSKIDKKVGIYILGHQYLPKQFMFLISAIFSFLNVINSFFITKYYKILEKEKLAEQQDTQEYANEDIDYVMLENGNVNNNNEDNDDDDFSETDVELQEFVNKTHTYSDKIDNAGETLPDMDISSTTSQFSDDQRFRHLVYYFV